MFYDGFSPSTTVLSHIGLALSREIDTKKRFIFLKKELDNAFPIVYDVSSSLRKGENMDDIKFSGHAPETYLLHTTANGLFYFLRSRDGRIVFSTSSIEIAKHWAEKQLAFRCKVIDEDNLLAAKPI